MKLRDLGPFAVFRHGGRVYVKSAGMVQRLERGGQAFDRNETPADFLDADVEPVDLTALLPGSTCAVCFGGGYAPQWDHLHPAQRLRCPNGCPVEGYVEPEVEKVELPPTCECCHRPLCDATTTAATSTAPSATTETPAPQAAP